MPRTYTGLDVLSDFAGQFPWKSTLVDVGDGVRQALVDEGPRESPVTFLLLHGNPTWGFLYREFIRALSPRYRVLVPDHVGFGRSDKPRDPSYYTLERHVANLEATLRAANADRVVPVMQDWGGPIGMGWATRHPEKVAGVVALNTWAFVKDPPMKLPWLFKFLVDGKGGWKRSTRNNIFVELIMRRGGTGHKMTDAELDPYRAPHPTPEDRVGIARFPQLIPETANPTHETWKTLEAIEDALPLLADRPALIAWALKDVAFRKAALDRWRRLFLDLDGPHLLPEAKHFLQEDHAGEILACIEPWAARRFADGQNGSGRVRAAKPMAKVRT